MAILPKMEETCSFRAIKTSAYFRCQLGATMLEAMLISLAVLLFMMSLIDCGRGLYQYSIAEQAVADAAREAVARADNPVLSVSYSDKSNAGSAGYAAWHTALNAIATDAEDRVAQFMGTSSLKDFTYNLAGGAEIKKVAVLAPYDDDLVLDAAPFPHSDSPASSRPAGANPWRVANERRALQVTIALDFNPLTPLIPNFTIYATATAHPFLAPFPTQMVVAASNGGDMLNGGGSPSWGTPVSSHLPPGRRTPDPGDKTPPFLICWQWITNGWYSFFNCPPGYHPNPAWTYPCCLPDMTVLKMVTPVGPNDLGLNLGSVNLYEVFKIGRLAPVGPAEPVCPGRGPGVGVGDWCGTDKIDRNAIAGPSYTVYPTNHLDPLSGTHNLAAIPTIELTPPIPFQTMAHMNYEAWPPPMPDPMERFYSSLPAPYDAAIAADWDTLQIPIKACNLSIADCQAAHLETH